MQKPASGDAIVMRSAVKSLATPDLSRIKSRRANRSIVTVNDQMERGYRYVLTQPIGRHFDPEFVPMLTPSEMLSLGVFGGKYMTDCRGEFPASWFRRAKLSPSGRNPTLN